LLWRKKFLLWIMVRSLGFESKLYALQTIFDCLFVNLANLLNLSAHYAKGTFCLRYEPVLRGPCLERLPSHILTKLFFSCSISISFQSYVPKVIFHFSFTVLRFTIGTFFYRVWIRFPIFYLFIINILLIKNIRIVYNCLIKINIRELNPLYYFF